MRHYPLASGRSEARHHFHRRRAFLRGTRLQRAILRADTVLGLHAVDEGAPFRRTHPLETTAHLRALFDRKMLEALLRSTQPLLLILRQTAEFPVALAHAALLVTGQFLPVTETLRGVALFLRIERVPALRAEAQVALMGRASQTTTVSDIMTASPFTVSPNVDMEACMQLMTDKRIRHLPVVENGKLLTMISIRDLLECTMQEQKYLIQQLEQYIRGESY